MSTGAPTAFVQEFASGITTLSQQLASRLRNYVMVKDGVVGESVYFDQIGATTAALITTRHGDTPLMNTPYDRRKADINGYEWADLIDKLDMVKTLNNPQNAYVQAGAAAMGRAIDSVIINAALGTSNTGVAGGTPIALPAAQKVAVNSWKFGTGSGNSGLTISKLIEARKILEGNEAYNPGMPNNELAIAVSAQQKANLLATTEVTSSDYNTVKALVNGEVDTFMGFKFLHSELLQTDGSGYRMIPAWVKSGIGLAIGADIRARISERDDKRYSTQVYFMMALGATRMEEKKVVQILADETV